MKIWFYFSIEHLSITLFVFSMFYWIIIEYAADCLSRPGPHATYFVEWRISFILGLVFKGVGRKVSLSKSMFTLFILKKWNTKPGKITHFPKSSHVLGKVNPLWFVWLFCVWAAHVTLSSWTEFDKLCGWRTGAHRMWGLIGESLIWTEQLYTYGE